MNLSDMSDADAKRLVDFAAGLVFGLHGTIERVTSKVFLLSPVHVEVATEEAEASPNGRGFFNQSEPNAYRSQRRTSPGGRFHRNHQRDLGMRAIGTVFQTVVFLFFLTLIGRLVFDWVQVLSRDWRPKGAVLVVAELVYTVTDPPLRLLRKIIPSINLGGMRIDIAFLVLMVITSLLMTIRIA
jgi:YggT family protein